MRFTSSVRWFFYSILSLMFVSGTTWWWFENFVRVQTALGEDHHPFQNNFIRIHGSLAFFFLILLGYLIHSHLRPGLNQKRSRYSGFVVVAWVSVLVLTAIYQLYGPEGSVRDFLTGAHRWVGVMLPLILITHVIRGRKRRRSKHVL